MKRKITIYVFLTFVFLGVLPNTSYANFTFNTIQYNGEDAIDLVFVGDGFRSDQQAYFDSKVTQAMGYVFDNPPFNTNQSNFNVYSLATVSNEAGLSYQGGTQVDTALKTFRNRDNKPRFTGIPDENRKELRDFFKQNLEKKVYVILLMNTTIYAGSGGLNEDDRLMSISQTTLYQTNNFRQLMIHEFGHGFGHLADEFGGDCTTSKPLNFTNELYDKKNVTLDNVNDRKWDGIVSSPQYILGANYCNNEWYRSSTSGLMRSLPSGATHNELGRILIQDRINEELAYNQKVVTYQDDGEMDLPSQEDRNIRIHADESILDDDLTCDNLYVAEDSNLTVNYGSSINCTSQTILGTISYVTEAPSSILSGGIRRTFGCKDPKALNYTRFATHRQSACVYDESDGRPPHEPGFLIEDEYHHNHNH